MHQLEWYVLVAVNYIIGPLFFVFFLILGALRVMKIVSPEKYRTTLIKIKQLSKLSRWERKGDYEKIIGYYKILAVKKKKHQFFYLGLVHLYKYNYKEAMNYLEKYIKIAVGNYQILRAKNYFGIGLLQAKNHRQALRVFEECRHQGNVFIIPYVLVLLLTKQYTKAQEFYENYPLPGWASPVMQNLLDFDKNDPNTIITIRESVRKLHPRFYLYQSAIEDLQERFELELFFNSSTSLQTLQEEVNSLCYEISQHPSLFESAQLQWFRKLLNEYTHNIQTKQIVWFEGIESKFESCHIKQLPFIFSKLHYLEQNSVHNFTKEEYEHFFHAVLPSSAKQVISYHYFIKYELFEDEKTHFGFVMKIDEEPIRVTLEIIDLQEVDDLKRLMTPLLTCLTSVAPELQNSFRRVLFEIMFNRQYKDYLKRTILPLIENLPYEHQLYFETIKEYYSGLQVSH